MPQNIVDVRDFLSKSKRVDAKRKHTIKPCVSFSDVQIKQNSNNVKFKLRCSRYLYTLTVKDKSKADKLKASLPAALIKKDIKKTIKKVKA